MRLQVRQTLLSLFVILLVMGVFLYVFVGLQTSRLLNDARANGGRQLAAFLGHLDTLERTAGLEEGAALTTRRALVQYSFALYAHLLDQRDWGSFSDEEIRRALALLDPQNQTPPAP